MVDQSHPLEPFIQIEPPPPANPPFPNPAGAVFAVHEAFVAHNPEPLQSQFHCFVIEFIVIFVAGSHQPQEGESSTAIYQHHPHDQFTIGGLQEIMYLSFHSLQDAVLWNIGHAAQALILQAYSPNIV